MLGRVTLNPLRHIDPIGTVILPAMALLYHFPVIGWAKPTPVTVENFRHKIRDDILTSVAGPASNFLVAVISVLGLRFLLPISHEQSLSEPLAVLLWGSVQINVLLGVFNLIPIPPLDGSHVLRHLLPGKACLIYDRIGIFGLLLLFIAGGGVIRSLSDIVMRILVEPFLRGLV
jgi:Zn-dependent protease